jgi:hypothetical protein
MKDQRRSILTLSFFNFTDMFFPNILLPFTNYSSVGYTRINKDDFYGGLSMIVYHGSDAVVEKPVLLTPKHTLDFGAGFYTTTNKEQASLHYVGILNLDTLEEIAK